MGFGGMIGPPQKKQMKFRYSLVGSAGGVDHMI